MASTEAKPRTAAPRVTTPWGAAELIDEVKVPQQAAGKRFTVIAQLLETRDGERLVRFAYATAGSARRGLSRWSPAFRLTSFPTKMRKSRDIERLRAALERAPALGEVLRV